MQHSPQSSAFNTRVYEIVRAIPLGYVLTYGKIAALIPPPPDISFTSYSQVRARWVGYAMAACPEDVPWHRVINAQGRVSQRPGFGPQLQRALLEGEGISFDDRERIDLKKYAWKPETDWLLDRGFLPQPLESSTS